MADKGFTKSAVPALSVCESPIEGKFIQAIFDYFASCPAVSFKYMDEPRSKSAVEFFSTTNPSAPRTLVLLQHRHPVLAGGRVDMLLRMRSQPYSADIAVELDGIRFHSSPEQSKRDRERDRALLYVGCPVMRFTGSDVYRADDAAQAAAHAINAVYMRLFGLFEAAELAESDAYDRGFMAAQEMRQAG